MISINLIVDHIATGAYVFKGVSAFLFCTSPLTQNRDLFFKNEPSGLLLHFKAQVDGITGALGYLVPILDLRIVVHVFLLTRLVISFFISLKYPIACSPDIASM